MLSKNSFGSLAIRSSSGSSMPRSANSAIQSTWTSSTSGSFLAWCSTIARSWKPVKGELTGTSLMSGWSFSKAALNSAMNFSPTSVPFHWPHRTSFCCAWAGAEKAERGRERDRREREER